ncbi:MAG: hypothetical protein LPK06_04005 [Marinobacter sp.]|nr:hypothetical protein [Marinobacter sp.]
MIPILKKHDDALRAWARSLPREALQLHDFGGWNNGVIMSPSLARHDLLTGVARSVFARPEARSVIYLEIPAGAQVPRHNHNAMSHYHIDENGKIVYHPFKGDFYKVTHVVIDCPSNPALAYMHINNRRHHWQPGHYEEFNVIYDYHYAVNDSSEPLRILYVEYYPDAPPHPLAGSG